VGGQLHAPAALLPGKDTGTHCIEDWVSSRTGLVTVVKTKISFPVHVENRTSVVHPAAKSLYWLTYPGSNNTCWASQITEFLI